MKKQSTIFRKCINTYYHNKKHNKKPIFFDLWFKKHGTVYHFVFKKNYKVTNIQYAELLSLIKSNIKIQGHIKDCSIQFASVKDFNDTTVQLFNTFKLKKKTHEEQETLLKLIESTYSKIFKHIIVVDAFNGSCSVYLPYNINLDIQKVCSRSGYIHSCGDIIYIERIDKTQQMDFFKKLKDYIEKNYSSEIKKILFTLYCHEDFTSFDKDGWDFFLNGLDDIKFYAEKLHMDSVPLTSIINDMKMHRFFSKRLDITIAGNNLHIDNKGKNKNSFWLIADKSVLLNKMTTSYNTFIICYNQRYKNENPYHFFDENKPGWIDHTTIPHTLIGAMLNISMHIAKKNKRKDQKISIFDPFIGSGTTFLELLKYEDVNFIGSDLNKLAQIVAKDNLHFFSLNVSELLNIAIVLMYIELHIYEQIKNYSKCEFIKSKINKINLKLQNLENLQSKAENAHEKAYNYLSRIFPTYMKVNISIDISDLDLQKNLPLFEDRLIFYTCLKSFKRNLNAFNRKSKDWATAFIKEISDLRYRIEIFIKLRNRASRVITNKTSPIIKYLGNYSFANTVNPIILNKYNIKNITKNQIKHSRDVILELKHSYKNKILYDIIITDPPYGFNTDEDIKVFAKLYKDMFSIIFKCLKPGGQLMICLPEKSNTGRLIHFFTHKETVIHQILIAAAENSKKLIQPANILPNPTWLFQPPYYWESEKALRRSILHFILSK